MLTLTSSQTSGAAGKVPKGIATQFRILYSSKLAGIREHSSQEMATIPMAAESPALWVLGVASVAPLLRLLLLAVWLAASLGLALQVL